MPHRMIVAAVALAALSACGARPTRVVETPIAVEIPGPVQWREIPAELLTCAGQPEVLRDGITGGELRARARGWQAYAVCLEVQLKAIGALGQMPPGP